MSARPEGYRYVRQYRTERGIHTGPQTRWALWEVRAGRARRVGTAYHESEYRAFLDQTDAGRV